MRLELAAEDELLTPVCVCCVCVCSAEAHAIYGRSGECLDEAEDFIHTHTHTHTHTHM